VKEVLDTLIENFIFNDPPTPAEVAAATRYVSFKNYNQLAKETKISDETIRKSLLKIEKFLGKRPLS
jgi:hypothetical protein